jgi:hypothetical protein
MKKFLLLFIVVTSLYGIQAQSLVINEVCYSNQSQLYDFEDDSPDWFELYNASEGDIHAAGFKVTDDTAKEFYWPVPDTVLKPGGFLVIFASGKDTVVSGQIHTSFKLSGIKEPLYLFNTDGEIVSRINPTCVPANYSLSRMPDGGPEMTVTESTPGKSNNYSVVQDVNFIPDTLTVNYSSGFYSTPITVTLSNGHPENSIMYTLNGDEPGNRSAVYNEPLPLNDLTHTKNRFANIPETVTEPGNEIFKANILRARVYSNGCPASNEVVCTYFINESIKGKYKVPLVSLVTDADNLFSKKTGIYVKGKYRNFDQHGSKWERDVHVEVFDTTGNTVIDQDAGMRIHGRGSRRSPQKSLRLYADQDYGKGWFDYPLFSQKPGIDSFRVLLLRTTGGTLGPLFKEELCNRIVQDMNIDYNAGETAILFINGEYWGIYNLMERQNGHYIEENYNLPLAVPDIIAYDRRLTVEEGTADEYNSLIAWLQSADPTDSSFYEEAGKKIDFGGLIDYYIAQLYFANYDWPASNVEMWKLKNDTARWRYFFFDSDASMIWVNDDHMFEHINDISDYQQNDEFCTLILKRLLKNDRFRNRFVNRFYQQMNTTFRTDRVTALINEFEKIYAPLVPEHIYRWDNPVDYNKWLYNVDLLRTFAMQRPLYISEQLERNFGSPVEVFPNPSGGNFSVRMADNAGNALITVYSANGQAMGVWSFDGIESGSPLLIRSGLPPGFYILRIKSGMIMYSAKLIIR